MEDYKLIEIAKQELIKNQYDEMLWKKCLALMQNNKAKAEDKYLRQRVIQLKKLSDSQLLSLEEKLILKQKVGEKKVSSQPKAIPNTRQTKESVESKNNEEQKNKSDMFISWVVITGILVLIFFLISSLYNEEPTKVVKKNNSSVYSSNKNSDDEVDKFGLVIITFPGNAQVKILNSNVTYFDGVRLKEGKYNVQVSAKGYETKKEWVQLDKYTEKFFDLKKKKIYLGTRPDRYKTNLSFSGLYYCLVEKEMIDYMTEKINNYSQKSVNKYDDYINNYRTYCASKKYYESDFSKAQKEKEKNLNIIREEALNRYSNDLYLKKIVNFKEKKPAPFKKVLTKNELLYCESEVIRLNAVKNKLQSRHYLKYDNLINDYNSRCKAKHYVVDMEHVEKIIKRNKTKIEKQGLKRFGLGTKTVSHTLTIKTNPEDTKVMIINIKPKYKDGIRLKEGKYHVKIRKKGYKVEEFWVTLDEDKYININMKKIKKLTKEEQNILTGKTESTITNETDCILRGLNWEYNSVKGKYQCQ